VSGIVARVFDHVTIRVSDRAESGRFYETVLRTLDIEQSYSGEHFAEWDDFSLAAADEEHGVTRRLHVAFAARSRAQVDEFWRVGTGAGYRSDGAPGPRPQYHADYYGAFLIDPDGNSAEAVHHGVRRASRGIDHLWIRVADVPASRRFYEIVAAHAGFRLQADAPEYAQFGCEDGSFSLVPGRAAENVHLAFPVADNERVAAFHQAATAAGYADNGAPGERALYHAGYYGAFVLDPDGNNVELVSHNRD
jgi:catechol 2,3-dioxygenase-like lactoylglutathione lyase family enzyme